MFYIKEKAFEQIMKKKENEFFIISLVNRISLLKNFAPPVYGLRIEVSNLGNIQNSAFRKLLRTHNKKIS